MSNHQLLRIGRSYRRNTIHDNLNPNQYRYQRYSYLTFERSYSDKLSRYKSDFVKNQELSQAISDAIKNNDENDALYAINRYYRSGSTDWIGIFSEVFSVDIFNCYDCDKYFFTDDQYHNVDHDHGVCDRCVSDYYYSERRECYSEDPDYDNEDDPEDSDLIGSYHSSKRHLSHIPSSFDKRNPQVFLGLELEVEIDSGELDSKASMILDNIGYYRLGDQSHKYCLLESDGSLDHGFEMVTAWTGLDVHQQQLKFFDRKFSGMKSHNTKTCGLHVHICKADMTTLHASKIVLFINDPKNIELIRAIARRDSSSYCKILNKKDDKSWLKDSIRNHSKKRDQLRALNADRYEAINFRNDNTVEFRLFKGSLVYSTIMACLEFTYATWFFCRESSVNDLTISQFLKFICRVDNRADTKFLRAYLVNKGFQIPEKAKIPDARSTSVTELVTFE